jgi:lipopolysaccharide/colanic/teichoic acid biosynthesis glycosyltransferase
VGLLGALPLALVIAAVNWALFRDWRKILFVQERVGRRGRVFRMFKFRTMHTSRQPGVPDARPFCPACDRERVTNFGRFLRCTHLDELPQLWNVLRGEMSLIGPRAEMLEIEAWAATQVPAFSQRLVLRPGITGLAQITQGYTDRNLAAYLLKHAINERYRRELAFGRDLSIVLRTVIWMLAGRGWRWKSQARTATGDSNSAPATDPATPATAEPEPIPPAPLRAQSSSDMKRMHSRSS